MAVRRNIFKRIGRAVSISAARVILRPREAPLPPRYDVGRILLVKLWAIGEYLMATPAFAGLRELFPEANITLLTGVAAAPLAAPAPFFDRVWTVPEQLFVRKRLGQLGKLRENIAAENFDLAVIFHHAWEFSAFIAWAGVPHRLGFDRDGDGFAHTVKVACERRGHQVEEYFELARACGAPGEPGPLVVVPGDEAEREAEHILTDQIFGRAPFILAAPGGGVNPKTSMEAKRWPADNYVELIENLKSDYNVVLVGGPSDAEVNTEVATSTGVNDLTGKTSLPALYVLMRRAAAFVGNDSAPMHVAAAAGAPTVAFFGPTDAARNGPWQTRSLVLSHDEECRPCYEDGYFPPCDHRRCLTEISAEEAAARIYDFLDSVAAKC